MLQKMTSYKGHSHCPSAESWVRLGGRDGGFQLRSGHRTRHNLPQSLTSEWKKQLLNPGPETERPSTANRTGWDYRLNLAPGL